METRESLETFYNPDYNWGKYLEFTKSTALLDDGQYYIAGLLSEIGEVAGIFKRVMRGDYEDVTPATYAELTKKLKYEFGDILWYLARVYCWYDRQERFISDIKEIQETELSSFARERMLDDFYNIEFLYDIARPFSMVILQGDLCEENELEDELYIALKFFYLLIFPYSSIESIANLNIDKLTLRQQAGTIKGTGDYR